jgi:hypothetical protein
MTTKALDELYQAFRQIGEDPAAILGAQAAHLVAHGHRVLSQQSVPGILIEAEAQEERIRVRVAVAEGCAIAQPVHLCFGLFERYGVQQIDLQLTMGEGSQASFWSHYLFTVPEVARHAMDARIELAPGARMVYSEGHYHGLSGGIEVLPKARVLVGEGAHFRADFSLTQGRVGLLDIDSEVGAEATAELTRSASPSGCISTVATPAGWSRAGSRWRRRRGRASSGPPTAMPPGRAVTSTAWRSCAVGRSPSRCPRSR